MTIRTLYPNVKPTLDLAFAATKTLDPRITFTRASAGTYVDRNGILGTAAINEARFDHSPSTLESLGLLVEEARTNSIRNNTMVGAVAGTPGTLPTNWGEALGGLTREVVGTGTQNGINYVDVRFFGTATGTQVSIRSEPINAVAASVNQTWTQSAYVSIVGGSTANISSVRVRIIERNAAAGFLFESSTTFSITSSLTRHPVTRTLTDATAAFVEPNVFFIFAVGAAIDITLRIGLPQLEQGAFATSVIPTSTVVVTRSADVASITGSAFSSWYRQDEGTVFYDGTVSQGLAAFPWFYNITDGTVNNSIGTYQHTSGIYGTVVTGGTAITPDPSVLFAPVPGAAAKHALAVKTSDTRAAYNRTLSAAQTSTVMPVVNQLAIGQRVTGNRMTGTIRRLTYWPWRLSNATLQALTS